MARPGRLVAALAVLLMTPLAACDSPPAGGEPVRSAPPVVPAPTPGDPPTLPLGRHAGWKLTFSGEFEGTSLDMSRWLDRSSAEPDEGRGNPDNEQLEWNQAANCRVGGGQLMLTAKREQVTSPSSGQRYEWTSCLVTTRRADAFQYGYLEERSILPAPRGFWPAFWTWQAGGVDLHTETDVYEFYSDNHQRFYSTQHSGAQGRCDWRPSFDPTTGWHTYGVAIEPSGTTWYADGVQVCHTAATSDGKTNIISNLAVYAKIPPAESTSEATKRVDYIRAWSAP